MKIKLDFVSNSSSTSFVYVSNGNKLSQDEFLRIAGVGDDSPLKEIFIQFYRSISQAITSGKKVSSASDIDEYIKKFEPDFTTETIELLRKSHAAGKEIVFSQFSTNEGNPYESELCFLPFEINSEEFFISALENVY